MASNTGRVDIGQIVESAFELEEKDRLQIMLKLFPTLKSSSVERLLEIGEQILADILLNEEKTLEHQAKFEYKEVKGGFYAYLRDWGGEKHNSYLGPMRFMPGYKYNLTHRLRKTVITLVSLGLYREEEKIYLMLQQLTPVFETQSYLYYDKNDVENYPRRPQISLENLFSKRKWVIECLGPIEAGAETQKTFLVSGVPTIEKLKSLEPIYQSNETKKSSVPSAITDVKQVQKTERLAAKRIVPIPMETPRNRKVQSVVQVKKNFIPGVIKILEQWEELSQAIPSSPQWKIARNGDGVALCNQAGDIVVQYDNSSQALVALSAHSLLAWLREIMFAVASSKMVSQHQQSIAERWLPRLECAPKQDGAELLAHLFNL